MPAAILSDRAVIAVSGPEARPYLDRLVTCDVDTVRPGRARYGALLTPQGKIVSDFVIFAGPDTDEGESLLLDAPAPAAADLVKRLALYRLRARIAVGDRSDVLEVAAGWGGEPIPEGAAAAAPDPRLPELGWRAVFPRGTAPEFGAESYRDHRIRLGIPESGPDFALGDAFPHEALMDQLAGVDFDKGCYVGQEVVSRMQHRGTARTRVVPVEYGAAPPPAGAEVRAGERVLGRTGSVAGRRGLALLRLDRVGDALAAGEPVTAGGVAVSLRKPDWARFPFPTGRAAPAA